MKSQKMLGVVMALLGAIVAAFEGCMWYQKATEVWIAYNKEGEVIGPGLQIALTIVGALIALGGIVLIVADSKNKKADK